MYIEVAALPVRYVGEGMQPAVDGPIDGTPATLLVDTGAFDTQLTMNGANRRDLNLHMTGRYVEGVGGHSRVYSTRLKEFSIGPARSARRTELLAIGQANLTPAFDGIAGSPFLLQTDLEVDLRNKQAKMFRPMTATTTPSSTNGRKRRWCCPSRAACVGSALAPHWTATFKTVQLGGETINNAELGIIDSQGAAPADLLLGQDFLRTHRVLFAMSQKKMYFAYLGGEPFSRSQGVPDWPEPNCRRS